MLSKEVSSNIFKAFGMTRPGIEPRSPRPLAMVVLDYGRQLTYSKQKIENNIIKKKERLISAVSDRIGNIKTNRIKDVQS